MPTMAAARRKAEDSARDFAVNDLRSGRQIDGRHIEITVGKSWTQS